MLKEILEKESTISTGLKKEMVKMIKEILKAEEGLKKKAEKLDERYKEETGKSFFFQYIYNGKEITKDDIKYIEKK